MERLGYSRERKEPVVSRMELIIMKTQFDRPVLFRIYRPGLGFLNDKFPLLVNIPSISNGDIVTQYTGKKDIDGKEICEGDFIVYTERMHEHGDAMSCCGVVVYDPNNACFAIQYPNSWLKKHKPNDPESDLDYFNYQSTVYGFKILGNVFENPSIVRDMASELGYKLDSGEQLNKNV